MKNFATGMNTMMIQDVEGGVYKSGLKIDYTPKKVQLIEEFQETGVQGLACGRKHYVMWNNKNQLLVWGNILKDKAQREADGFGLHDGYHLFEGGSIRDLSMKYGIFGGLIEHDTLPTTPGL